MSLRLVGLRRSTSLLLVAIALALAIPSTALAGGSVNCHHYGQLFTYGTANGAYHYHWVDTAGTTPNLGTGYKSRNWGYFSSWHDWDVWGSNISSENANCFVV